MTWFRLSLEHVRSMCIVLSCQSVMFMKRFASTGLSASVRHDVTFGYREGNIR